MRGLAVGILLFLSLVSVSGCLKGPQSRPSYPVRAKIPFFTQNGEYRWNVVQIETLENLEHVEGRAARFLFRPKLVNLKLEGEPPLAQFFTNKEGILIAKNQFSLKLITLYYHFEQLMKIDEKIGVYQNLSWPRTVALDVIVEHPTLGKSGGNNAMYIPDADAYVFEKFSGEHLPLSVNAGVIAHEHFHAIFNHAVLKPLKAIVTNSFLNPLQGPLDKWVLSNLFNINDPFFNNGKTGTELLALGKAITLLDIWNEGFADWWGFHYSGDGDFVLRSISQTIQRRHHNRKVEVSPSRIIGNQELESQIKMVLKKGPKEFSSFVSEASYYYGAQIADTMAFLLNQSPVDRLTQFQVIYLMLKQLTSVLASGKSVTDSPWWLPSAPLILISNSPEFEAACSQWLSLVPPKDLEQLEKNKIETCRSKSSSPNPSTSTSSVTINKGRGSL
ncbi:MAG: hypothetical protein RMK80_05835 [Pseudobdellovibrionaceae bacterium]|nr:hypothetical protein [Pseudobdellovibrionaceae bacterium]